MGRLGVIQGVNINDEGYCEEEEKRTIWFVQNRVRHVSLAKLRKRDFKVASVLVKVGYEISDQEKFDLELKKLFE